MFKRCLLCLLLLLAPHFVHAEPGILGTMDATAYEPLPQRLPLRVVPSTGLVGTQDLKRLFEEVLHQAGHEITGINAYEFRFRLSEKVERTRGEAPIRLEGSGGSSSDSDDAAVTMRWRLKREQQGGSTRDRLLVLTLIDPTGHVVWEARADLHDGGRDAYDLLSQVAPSIVGQMGNAVTGMQLP